jgi:predicted dehydrogenase
MKQVLQNAAGSTLVRDVPAPPCPPTSVLVRNEFSVISSGTERSRVEAGQKSLVGRVRERPELALKAVDRVRKDGLRQTRELIRRTLDEEAASGYSSAGTILEVGAGVRGLSVGDRVACAGAGHANHAEIVSIPRNLCAKVPADVPMEAAALTTIASIALHGIRLADVRLGERVAVIGCGLVGQIACRLLTASGADVIGLDTDPARVEAARLGGADHGVLVDETAVRRVLEASGGVGVDAAIVTAASDSNSPLVLATDVARDRASVVLVGAVPIEVPRALFFDKELSFRVSRSYGPGRYDPEYEERGLDYPIGYVRWTEQRNMECILDLQARGRLVLGDLIEEVLPIEQAEEAYARLSGPFEERPRGALAFSYPSGTVETPRPVTALPPTPHGGSLRVGLIGPGGFANSVLIPAFSGAGATLAAVAGGAGPSAAATARKAGFASVADDAQALIADQSVDALVIATRHGSHAALASAGLDAGKHVFCEKPLALDREQLEEVLAAAERAQRVLMVGFNRRFSPQLVALREFVRGFEAPMSAVYRVSAGNLPSQHWLHDLEQGGGRIIGEGCHFLDALTYVTGSPIVRVHASGFGAADLPAQSRDNLSLTVDFANGSVGTLAYVARGAASVAKERLEVFAGTRTAILDDFRHLDLFDGDAHKRDRLRVQDKGHNAEVKAFIEGVREGSNPIPLATIANVHLACYAAVESISTGLPTDLP